MAQRAYLYSIDSKPTKDNREGLKVRGLSEWNFLIPPSFLMLVGGNMETSSSLIYKTKEKVALVGNYNEGVENLRTLVNLVKDSNVQYPEVFEGNVKDAFNFLESKAVKQKYIILEPGELLEMSGVITTESIESILDDVKNILRAIKMHDINKINEYVGDDIATHWEELLGITNWIDTLYIDLNQN